MKTIVYARTANASQMWSFNALPRQIAKCTEVLTRMGLQDAKTLLYQEQHTGSHLSEMQHSLLSKIRSGDVIIATYPSRISRNLKELTMFKHKVYSKGAFLFFAYEVPFQTPPASIASGELKSTI